MLPHEFVHSWNGKYRRPAGQMTADYQQPMKDDLLWVYEGLTQYCCTVLTARSGLCTAEHTRDYLACVAGSLEHTPGRAWRPLADTAVAAPTLYQAPEQWRAWRRGVDFYAEGVLIWLEANVIIRQKTGGRKSLDDFCRGFFFGPSGTPAVRPYTLDDVVAAMEDVVHHPWREFLAERLESTAPHAPWRASRAPAGGWPIKTPPTASSPPANRRPGPSTWSAPSACC